MGPVEIASDGQHRLVEDPDIGESRVEPVVPPVGEPVELPTPCFTSTPPPDQELRSTVNAPDHRLCLGLFAPRRPPDPSLFVCPDTRTPEGVAIASAQYASGDPELQAAALEALKDSDALNMCFDPRYEENEVFIVAQRLSENDPDKTSEGALALEWLVSTNPEARERIEELAGELEGLGGGFERRTAAVLREAIETAAGPLPGEPGSQEGRFNRLPELFEGRQDDLEPVRFAAGPYVQQPMAAALGGDDLGEEDISVVRNGERRGRGTPYRNAPAAGLNAQSAVVPSTAELIPGASDRSSVPPVEIVLTPRSYGAAVQVLTRIADARDPERLRVAVTSSDDPLTRFFRSLPMEASEIAGQAARALVTLQTAVREGGTAISSQGETGGPLHLLLWVSQAPDGHRQLECGIIQREVEGEVNGEGNEAIVNLHAPRPASRRGGPRGRGFLGGVLGPKEKGPSNEIAASTPVFAPVPPPSALFRVGGDSGPAVVAGAKGADRGFPPVTRRDRPSQEGRNSGDTPDEQGERREQYAEWVVDDDEDEVS